MNPHAWNLLNRLALLAAACVITLASARAEDLPKAMIDGTGPGFRPLEEADFTNVNCHDDTWTWKDGVAHCTGKPVGVIRTKQKFTNFELVAQWRHETSGGNSGIFVWTSDEAIEGLKPGALPKGGIEVQVLDHGYAEQYEKENGKPSDWFTSNGDVFAVGAAKMKPYHPISPDGSRSFPRKNLSRGHGEWNHYYVRAINGEIRLWVNGEEVSGGHECEPSTGYLCLESEGAPVEFKNLRIREIPAADGKLAGQEGWTELFNGKDLAGWKGDEKIWSVQDGLLTGQTTPETNLKANTFAVWDGEVDDFKLQAEFRLIGDNNSGVQYRSQPRPENGPYAIQGYQADIHPAPNYVGMLYDEGGRGIAAERGQQVILGEGDDKQVRPLPGEVIPVDLTRWNKLTVIARGNRLIHKLNGQISVDVTDNDPKQSEARGLLALQVHVGAPMKVQYKSIRLKKLSGDGQ